MKALSSYINFVPLAISFDVKLRTDSLNDTFKLWQSVVQTFYKVYAYSFEFGGMRIPVQLSFPEQIPNDKQIEFSYGSTQKYIETSFSLNIETYFPQKDLSTERFRGNLMQAGIKVSTKLDEKIPPYDDSSLFGPVKTPTS
jgi:hypothetical protein